MHDYLNHRDFYAMLVEDFDDFMSERHSVRRAWHCAITAYHLHEWVWGDWLKNDAVAQNTLKIKNKKDFLAWIDAHCVWFAFVQQLANGAKHFVRSPGFQPIHIGGHGEGPLGLGPHGRGYLLLDMGEGAGDDRWQLAGDFLEVVVRFWRDFFQKYLPSPDLPISKHHADQQI